MSGNSPHSSSIDQAKKDQGSLARRNRRVPLILAYCEALWMMLFTLLDAPFRYLFGRDVFVSYSRADASKYVPNLANELRSQMPDLSFYLDRWVAPPSRKLPRSLRRQLRWSSILVIVASENAINSRFVKDEIRRFAKTGRQLIPINVSGAWDRVDWDVEPWRDVKGAAPEVETLEDILKGTPAREVIDRIGRSVDFSRQDQRLRRAVRATVFGILFLIAGAIIISSVIIQRARAEAAQRIGAAEAKEREANIKAG